MHESQIPNSFTYPVANTQLLMKYIPKYDARSGWQGLFACGKTSLVGFSTYGEAFR